MTEDDTFEALKMTHYEKMLRFIFENYDEWLKATGRDYSRDKFYRKHGWTVQSFGQRVAEGKGTIMEEFRIRGWVTDQDYRRFST